MGPVWFVVIVMTIGAMKTGGVFEWIVPGWLIIAAVTVTLWTLPVSPISASVAVPKVALREMLVPGPFRFVSVIFPLLVLTLKSVPALSEIVPLTKAIGNPFEESVTGEPAVKLKLVPAL